jgi:hypothetical protein
MTTPGSTAKAPRLNAREKDFIFRCALAARFTSPTVPAKRPLVYREIARLIREGFIYNPNGGGYRPTTKGAELVADMVKAALSSNGRNARK